MKVFGILTTMVGINVIFLVHSALLVLGAIFTFIGMYITNKGSRKKIILSFKKGFV